MFRVFRRVLSVGFIAQFSLFAVITSAVAQEYNVHSAFKNSAYADLFKNSQNSDLALIDAMRGRQTVRYLQAYGLTVIKTLPDDTIGNPHQKFLVRTSNNGAVLVVYNTGLCPRVPVQAGDVVSVAGEYIWNNSGGLMHWTHFDPRGGRQNGFVGLGNQFYCSGK